MQEFSVLEKECLLPKQLALEASAGTGKTFAIEHIFLRFLLEKNIPFSSIYILTFTRAATRELKARVRANLQGALDGLYGKRELFPYLEPFYHDSTACKKAILLIQEALFSFYKVKIFTIHGFCQHILTDFAQEEEESVDCKEQKDIYLQPFLHSYLLRGSPASLYSFELAEISKFVKKDSSRLFTILLSNSSNEKVQTFEEIAQALWKELNNKEKSYPELVRDLINYKKSKYSGLVIEKECFLWDQLIKQQSYEDFFPFLLTICEGSFCLLDVFKEKQKRKKIASSDSSTLLLVKKLFPFIQQAKSSQRIIALLQRDIAPLLYSYCLQENIFYPDQLLLRARNALLQTTVKDLADKNMQALIVDEFQDTDSLQWEILYNFLDSKRYFYIVGDPKQSIYGFRRADIYTYLNAKNALQSVSYLRKNFRSSYCLVQALNKLLENFFFQLPKTNESIKYQPLLPKDDIISKSPSIHFFVGQSFTNRSIPSAQDEERLFFPFIAKEIISLAKEKFPLQRIAILVRDKYQAENLQKYLANQQIPANTNASQPLAGSFAEKHLIAFLEAVVEPFTEGKLRRFLLGPYANWSIDLIQKPIPSAIYSIFSELKEIADNKSLGELFQKWFTTDFGNGKTTIENIVLQKDLFDMTINYIQEILCFEPNAVLTSSYLQRFLSFLHSKKQDKIVSCSSHDAVQILTIHMSKGLEFDVVFALGLYNRTSQTDNAFRSVEEIDAEKQRQFYVAITRAKHKLYLPIIFSDPKESVLQGKASPIELFLSQTLYNQPYQQIEKESVMRYLHSLTEKHSISFSLLSDIEFSPLENKNAISLIKPTNVSIQREEIFVHSFSSLSPTNVQSALSPVAIDSSILRGASFGSFIHNLLEKIIGEPFTKESVRYLLQKHISSSSFHAFYEEIEEMIFSALFSPLHKNINLSALSPDSVYPEIPFQFREKNLWKGFIDLLLFHEGKYYIIDWKSNWLGEDLDAYSHSNLQKEMEKHNYYMQAAIYVQAVRKYLEKREIDFSSSFGGVLYIFIRALPRNEGVIHFFPQNVVE